MDIYPMQSPAKCDECGKQPEDQMLDVITIGKNGFNFRLCDDCSIELRDRLQRAEIGFYGNMKEINKKEN
jgi:hypothetical protein